MNIRKTNNSISKKLQRLENALKSKLNAFYNSNIKGNIAPIETIRQQFESKIKTIIRAAVQQSYLSGTDLVTNQVTNIDDNFEVFISQRDIQNISSLTDKLNDQFWKTATRLHRRESEFLLLPNQDLQLKNQFDTAAAIIGVSAYTVFTAFNEATVNKLQDISSLGIVEGSVMFLTEEDARVDPEICEPLNRTVYEANDPDIPFPPLHNFCRCRLVPIVNGIPDESL
jgi:hypothetical protein